MVVASLSSFIKNFVKRLNFGGKNAPKKTWFLKLLFSEQNQKKQYSAVKCNQ